MSTSARGFLIIFLAGIAVSVTVPAEDVFPGQVQRNGAEAALERARQFRKERQWDSAIAACDEALQHQPDSAEAHMERGQAWAGKREYEKSLDDLNKAVQLDPTFVGAWTSRAVTNRHLGNLQDSIADCNRAIQLEPNSTRAYRSRARAYLAQGETGNALLDANRAIDLDPGDGTGYFVLGDVHRAAGHGEKAIDAYSKGLELQPDIPRYLYIRAEWYRFKGEPKLAVLDYTRVIEIDPTKPAAYYGRGEAFLELGNLEDAIRDFSYALSKDDGLAYAYASRGEAYRRAGKYDEAIADLQRAIELDPSLTGVESLLIAARADRFTETADSGAPNDDDRAAALDVVRQLEQKLHDDPQFENVDLLVGLGNLRGQIGDQQGAIAAFDRALELAPESIDAHIGRGVAMHRLGHFEDSLAEYAFVLRVQPENLMARLHLAIASGELDRRGDERNAYTYLLEKDSNNTMALFNLGIACREDRDLSSARGHFEKYTQLRPEDADGYSNLASVLIDLDHSDKANVAAGLAAAKRALALDPDHVVANYHAGVASLLLNNGEEFVRVLPRLRSLAPEWAARLEGLRIVLTPTEGSSPDREIERLAEQFSILQSREDYTRAILVAQKRFIIAEQALGRGHPATRRALRELAEAEIALGRFQDALKHLKETSAEREPAATEGDALEAARVLHDLAMVEMFLGQLESSERTCHASLSVRRELAPDDIRSQCESASLLFEILVTQGRTTEASEVLEKWSALVDGARKSSTPLREKDLRVFGTALFRSNFVDRSRVELRRALESGRAAGQDAEVARAEVALAAIDLRLGEWREAKEKLGSAVQVLRDVLGQHHPDMAGIYALLGHSLRMSKEYEEAETELRRALGIYQEHRSQPRGELQRAMFGERLGVGFASSELVATLIGLRRYVDAMQVIEDVRAGALIQRMGAKGTYISPFAWKSLGGQLSENDAMLSLVWGPSAVSAITVAPRSGELGVRGWILVDDTDVIKDLEERGRALTKWLGRPPRHKDRPNVRALATELGRTLFDGNGAAPPGDQVADLRQLLRHATRLVIIPDAPVAQIPFDLLLKGVLDERPDSLGSFGADGAIGSVMNIVYAPSGNLLAYLRHRSATLRAQDVDSKELLLVGPTSGWPASALPEDLFSRESNRAPNNAPIADFSTLGGMLTIANGIDNDRIRTTGKRTGYKVTLLDFHQATRVAVEERLKGKEIVHFLAHGFPGTRSDPYNARIVLSPSGSNPDFQRDALTLDRILDSWSDRLTDCRLISFAACKTQLAVPVGTNAITMPWGCFYAGCPTVIATLWDVKQDAAYQVMNRFYENLLGAHKEPRHFGQRSFGPGEPMTTSESLAEAKAYLSKQAPRREFIREGEPADYSDPYYWAGFVVIGDPE